MRFREFLTEAGQIRLNTPQTFRVLYRGKITQVQGVSAIDPRLELYNLSPSPNSKLKKFLGEVPFSLPVFGIQGDVIGYIVTDDRGSMISGTGRLSKTPIGKYEDIPLNWADRAEITDSEGEDLLGRMVTTGGPLTNLTVGEPHSQIR